MKKRCIFHIPYNIKENWPSGSSIRPTKMMEAFKKIGYEVDIVQGYGAERKEAITRIKDNIKNGTQYDFLYAECSTAPTIMTEKNHLPRYPFMDFSFMKFCKKNGIKIGLFYRDVYWRFDMYKKSVPFLKRVPAKMAYYYDLINYKKLLDIFYLPAEKMFKYVPLNLSMKIEELPPAIDTDVLKRNSNKSAEVIKNGRLKIFYVGGISDLYNLEQLFMGVNKNEKVELTVCCREKEWEKEKSIYSKYLNDRIKVIHKAGKELEPYFAEADMFSLYFMPEEYRTFAIPVKLFEYLTYSKPIISTKGTATGDFIEKNNCGWSIDYSINELTKTLNYIIENPQAIVEKQKIITSILKNHTWEARAEKVAKDLSVQK